MSDISPPSAREASRLRGYNLLLLLVAGFGGLLYGVDIGIIGGALPYLEATSGLSAGELSVIVAAVLLGSVISTLCAGLLANWIGRKPLMMLSGLLFVVSIPVIALSHGFSALFAGRLLQGMSAGFIGVVVPLYLAECLPSSTRGRGTGIFQWLLTLGIVVAALLGIFYSYRIEAVTHLRSPGALFTARDQAWRQIFWVSLPPGVLFVLGSLLVTESPRWLFERGRQEQALHALLRSRIQAAALQEVQEMKLLEGRGKRVEQPASAGSLLKRRYVVPFLLACTILFCNTATGVNSIIGYNTAILLQSGLTDLGAHWGYVVFTLVNFLMTIVGMSLVDRVGRKVLLVIGTGGLIVSLAISGSMFLQMEHSNLDCRQAVQALVNEKQELTLPFNAAQASQLATKAGDLRGVLASKPSSLVVIYSYAGFSAATAFARSDDRGALPLHMSRDLCIPTSRVEAFFKNPWANYSAAKTAPLTIERAWLAPIPSKAHGWRVAASLYAFIAFFAMGPGVCVWLALSELMPTRIRSVGMSIALVINQLVSTLLAVLFLPVVSQYGYSTMFFLFSAFTIVYFLTAIFLLPETKGKTLEAIESSFVRVRSAG